MEGFSLPAYCMATFFSVVAEVKPASTNPLNPVERAHAKGSTQKVRGESTKGRKVREKEGGRTRKEEREGGREGGCVRESVCE